MSKMFYKKMTLASLIAASALVSSMANAADDSDTLSLQVSGTINPAPCGLIVSKTALDLGSSLISDLKTSDQTPAEIGTRTLQVSLADCQPTTNVELRVLGASAVGDSTLLANSAATNAATNVGVGVWNKKDGSQVKIGGDPIVLTPGSSTMTNLDFALVKADATNAVTAGDVTTTAQIKVTFL
jgi:type 1 fimbria pilin